MPPEIRHHRRLRFSWPPQRAKIPCLPNSDLCVGLRTTTEDCNTVVAGLPAKTMATQSRGWVTRRQSAGPAISAAAGYIEVNRLSIVLWSKVANVFQAQPRFTGAASQSATVRSSTAGGLDRVGEWRFATVPASVQGSVPARHIPPLRTAATPKR
jgi:hypothetical protein